MNVTKTHYNEAGKVTPDVDSKNYITTSRVLWQLLVVGAWCRLARDVVLIIAVATVQIRRKHREAWRRLRRSETSSTRTIFSVSCC